MTKFLKEGLFVAVFILIVVLIVGILFEEFIPKERIKQPETYKQSASTAKLLSQIAEEQQSETKEEEQESVLQSYEVTADNLDNSERKSDYVQGKNHPFYDYTKAKSTNDSTSGDDTNYNSGSTTNSNTTQSSKPDDLKPSTNSTSDSNNKSDSKNTTNKINTSTLRDTSNSNKTSK